MTWKIQDNSEREMVNYLLDGMTEEEQAQFEDRFFAEDDLFEQLQMLKRELIDAYVRDQLDPVLRQQFERVWLASDEGRREVEFAQALRLSLNERNARDTKAFMASRRNSLDRWFPRKWGLVAALAVLALAGLAWLLRGNQPSDGKREQDLTAASPLSTETPAPLPSLMPISPAPPAPIPLFTLIASTRGDVAKVGLPANATRMRLRFLLDFDPGPNAITARLKDAGENLLAHRSLQYLDAGNGLYAVWEMSTSRLKPGRYVVVLTSSGKIGAENAREVPYLFDLTRAGAKPIR